MVRKLSKEPLLCGLDTPLTQLFNLPRGHVLQSGITRESLKVSPMLDRTAADAAMILFWSHGRKRPMGWRDDVSAVMYISDSRGRCRFTCLIDWQCGRSIQTCCLHIYRSSDPGLIPADSEEYFPSHSGLGLRHPRRAQ